MNQESLKFSKYFLRIYGMNEGVHVVKSQSGGYVVSYCRTHRAISDSVIVRINEKDLTKQILCSKCFDFPMIIRMAAEKHENQTF
jgi:hypothetical protein